MVIYLKVVNSSTNLWKLLYKNNTILLNQVNAAYKVNINDIPILHKQQNTGINRHDNTVITLLPL